MPRLSKWMIRMAYVYLMLGFTVGGLLLSHKGVPFLPDLWRWLPVHIDLLFVGWVVQLVMGVAFWVLPRFWQPPRRPRAYFAVVAFFCLNVGVCLAILGVVLSSQLLLVAGRVGEFVAVVFFGLHAWRRIVSRDGV
ncbi:MAG: cbb3-type cytochrome c oxidase subunit I [Candidatus Promineifilaceae bacterium]